jgi:hypothetical protein
MTAYEDDDGRGGTTMRSVRAALVLVAAVAFAASPWFVDNFAGYDPALFPVQVPDPLIQPAGYAFAIWGLIYAWLIAHALFGLVQRRDDPEWDSPRRPLILSLAIGTFWLAVATAAPVAATVMIWAMLALALIALGRLGRRERWILRAPVALYAGWLTAAAAVSLGVVLSGYGILGDRAGAYAMLVLALAVALWVQLGRTSSPVYALGVIWALAGIAAEAYGRDKGVAAGAVIGIVGMNLALLRRAAA